MARFGARAEPIPGWQLDDDQQVDLTRFSLFFPEKRPFFLENADLFTAGLRFLPGRTSGRTALFHSRRIGVASGEQVPISWGSRVSGRK